MKQDCPELRSEVGVHEAAKNRTQAGETWSEGGACFLSREGEGRERTSHWPSQIYNRA